MSEVNYCVPVGNKHCLVDTAGLLLIDDGKIRLSTVRVRHKKTTEISEYRYVRLSRSGHLLHRLVVGAKKGQIVDHINGDPLDNRSCNLRICSHGQNMLNRRFHKNKTGLPGVQKYHTGYQGRISVNGTRYRSKMFPTKEEAHDWYIAKKHEMHGDFVSYEMKKEAP